MKKIEAIIRPFKVDAVKEALVAMGVEGMTTIEVKGYGRQKGHLETYRGSEYTVDFNPKVMIIVVLEQALLADALSAIAKAARTEKIGDGKIFVTSVDDVVRIRTEESGTSAL